MKKLIINLGFILGVSTMVVGCTDYLDSDYLFEERVNIENVFQSKDYTNEWLAKGYAYMNHDYLQQVNSKKNTSFNFADDMYYIDLNYVDWKGGNYTEKGLLPPTRALERCGSKDRSAEKGQKRWADYWVFRRIRPSTSTCRWVIPQKPARTPKRSPLRNGYGLTDMEEPNHALQQNNEKDRRSHLPCPDSGPGPDRLLKKPGRGGGFLLPDIHAAVPGLRYSRTADRRFRYNGIANRSIIGRELLFRVRCRFHSSVCRPDLPVR